MTDLYDRAAEIEQLHRQAALEAHAAKQTHTAPVSAYQCEECSEPIPEARRQAVIGCRCCINCQKEIEQYGKTRFT